MTDTAKKVPQFVSFSFLTPVLGNLNRDENGRPKTLDLGGVQRIRLSSQSQKAVWRKSPILTKETGEGFRTRKDFLSSLRNQTATNRHNDMVEGILAEIIFGEKKDPEKSKGKGKGKGKDNTPKSTEEDDSTKKEAGGQIASLSLEMLEFCKDLFHKELDLNTDRKDLLASVKADWMVLKRNQTNILFDLFGAMSTANAESAEATMMVANAISVHRARIEVDYFTSMDDLKETGGAGYLSDSFFSSGLLCSFVCVNVGELVSRIAKTNIKPEDLERTGRVLGALVEVLMTEYPKGKQSNYAQTPTPIYMRVEFSDLPLNPQMAFLDPLPYNGNIGMVAIRQLQTYLGELNRSLNRNTSTMEWFSENGSMEDLKRFLSLNPIPTLQPSPQGSSAEKV